ncbi:MAG: hypothetical protein KAU06_07465, partial [Candidatus Marinimicrobia bacterium]|nr:hypothetical protein [Candidatus Neomarinimicrobiota bacterium]
MGCSMKLKFLLFLIIISISVLSVCTFAGTEVSGTISQNTTWSKANSPYIVTSNIYVQKSGANVRLTIEPGVEIRFQGAYRIYFGSSSTYGGCLTAVGMASDSIRFTAA